MATCNTCDSDMTTADHCVGGLDTESFQEALEVFGEEWFQRCGDCGVKPGSCHHPGCDQERCGACRGQAAFCNCGQDEEYGEANEETYRTERANNRWLGVPNGYLACFKLGWFCRTLHHDGTLPTPERPMIVGSRHSMRWHETCTKDDPGAGPDLNKWHRHGCPTGDAIDKILKEHGYG